MGVKNEGKVSLFLSTTECRFIRELEVRIGWSLESVWPS